MKKIILSLILPTFLLLNVNSLSCMENSKEHQDILKVLALTYQKPNGNFISEIREASALLPSKPSMENDMYAMGQLLRNASQDLIAQIALAVQRPNEVLVPMWGSNSITASSSIESPLIISTNGLNGCSATALHIKYNNGEQYAGITHYPPFSEREQEEKLKLQCLEALKAQVETKKIIATNFFFIVPNYIEKIFLHGYILKRDQILKDIVKKELVKTATINAQQIPYDEHSYLMNTKKKRDVEIILYPDKATLEIKGKIINL